MMPMTRTREFTAAPYLLLAFELSERTWKLGFSDGSDRRAWRRQVDAGAVARLAHEIARAKAHFKLPADAAVVSCYEAGRDGFWLHRYLVGAGVINYVVDSSSIEVNRRARRAKSDGLDLIGLLRLLARYVAGESGVWHVVRVPSVADEDARQLHRLRETIQQERTRLIIASMACWRAGPSGRAASRFPGAPGGGALRGRHARAGRLAAAPRVRVGAVAAAQHATHRRRCDPHGARGRSPDRNRPVCAPTRTVAGDRIGRGLDVSDRDFRLAADSQSA